MRYRLLCKLKKILLTFHKTYREESTAGPDSQAITTSSSTLPTSALPSEPSTLPPEHAEQVIDGERHHRHVRIRSPAWLPSPRSLATPHLSGAVPVVERSEHRSRKRLFMVCVLLALIALLLLLLALVLLLLTVTAARPAKLVYPLVCTVSTNYSRSGALPRDGLCGYLFYDSLYKGGRNFLTGRLSQDVNWFADRARHNTFTEFGMSFSIENANLLTEYTTPAFQRGLDALVQKQVIHYGIMDMHLQFTSNDTVAQALTILKRVNDHLATTASTRTRQSLMAIGMSIDDSTRRTYIVDLIKSIFKPHLFISMAHIPAACTSPKDYSSPDSYTLFKSCIAPSGSQDFPPAEGCPNGNAYSVMARNYDYNATLLAGFTFDRSIEVVMVFDSKKGMKNKFCDLKQHHLNLSYGIAAYDADFDSIPHPCSFMGIDGPYSRIDFLTRLRDFIAQNYTGAANKANCNQVT
ncbi:hypothetical protein MTO96_002164 [Rhipicephalus appendiculatus]